MIFLSPAFLSKAPVNKRRETICCVHSALCTAHSETNAQTAPPSAICQAITLYKLASQFWKHIAFGFSSKPTEIVLNIVSQDFLSSYYVTTFTAMNHPMIYNGARETLRSANRAVFYQKQRVTTYKADKCEDKFFKLQL